MKQLLALLLALVMVIGLFAGCSQQEEAEAPAQAQEAPAQAQESSVEEGEKTYTPDEYYVIQLVGSAIDGSDSTLDSKLGQYIAERFGIVFEYVPYTGDYWEYLTLQLAGGTYGEVVWLQQEQGFRPYADAGVLLNLEDYKDLLPDFYEFYEDEIPIWKARTEDGGIYGWDYDLYGEWSPINYWDVAVRSDVLEYYDYPELVTASDYIEFMEKAIVDFPTALDGSATTGIQVTFGESYGIAGLTRIGTEKATKWSQSNGPVCFDYENLVYVNQVTDAPEVKETVAFWNECYQKGLLDVESFTDLGDQQVSKMSVGQPIMIFYTLWNNATANNALTNAGHPEMSYVSMPFQLDSQKGQLRGNNSGMPGNTDSTFGLTDKCKDPERILTFINWCCTDEGQTMIQSGFEGETYIINEDGVREATELRYEIAMSQDLAAEWGIPQTNLQVYPPLPQAHTADENGVPFNFAWDQAFMDEFGLTDREKEVYYEGLGWSSSKGWWIENRQEQTFITDGAITLPGDSDLGKEEAAANECYIRNVAGIIMADDFEAAWADFLEEYAAYDLEGIVNEYNRLYQEFLANQ